MADEREQLLYDRCVDALLGSDNIAEHGEGMFGGPLARLSPSPSETLAIVRSNAWRAVREAEENDAPVQIEWAATVLVEARIHTQRAQFRREKSAREWRWFLGCGAIAASLVAGQIAPPTILWIAGLVAAGAMVSLAAMIWEGGRADRESAVAKRLAAALQPSPSKPSAAPRARRSVGPK